MPVGGGGGAGLKYLWFRLHVPRDRGFEPLSEHYCIFASFLCFYFAVQALLMQLKEMLYQLINGPQTSLYHNWYDKYIFSAFHP
jgi:hypothetical protein